MLANMGAQRMLPALAFLLVPLALVAGCGSSGDDTASDDSSSSGTPSMTGSPSETPSSSPSASTSPAPAGWSACGTLWKDGATLPKRYPGCSEDGAAVPAHRIGCSSGQVIVVYGDHYFAVPGGLIRHTERVLWNSAVYESAIATCRG